MIVLAVLVTSPCALAQEQRPAPPFRTGADLVVVDAVVLDDDGKPVTNLTAADFELLDQNVAQRIELFQPVSGSSIDTVTATREGRFAYSTNVGAGARPTRSFVLFFDDVHLTREHGDRAKEALATFVRNELRAGDLVSVVSPGRALRWHAQLPAGRDELTSVIKTLQGVYRQDETNERMSDWEAYRIHVFQDEQVAEQVDRRWKNYRVLGREPTDLSRDPGFRPETRGGTAGLIKPDIAIRAAAVYQQSVARNRTTLMELDRTIEGLESVRGRKSVMLVSPGFIADQEQRDAREVIDAARRSNVAIYFLDARGLMTGSAFSTAQYGSPLDARDVGAANAAVTLEAEGAEEVAASSGGFSIRNTNDLGGALARVGRELQAYYLLGFQPSEVGKAGSFRKLQVKVKRPGLTVRARSGYYVGGPPSGPRDAPSPGSDTLELAASSPYELDGIPVRASAFVFGEAAAGSALVLLAVEADLRAFAFKPQADRMVDVLDLRMLATPLSGGQTERYEREIEMTFPVTAKFNEESWYNLAQEFRLAPGRYQARIAVRDRNSGMIGAVTHDFVVPQLEGFRVTTPIVTDTIETPGFGSTAQPKPVLVVRRAFPAGATLYYQFNVLGATASGGPAKVVAGHEVRRADGGVVKRLEPRPIAAGPEGRLSRFSGISLADVPAGDYELVLRVSDELGGNAVELHEPFSILPPGRAPIGQ